MPKFTHVGFGKGKALPILEQINSDSGRRYKTPKGDLYPSVTTVLGLGKEEKLKGWVAVSYTHLTLPTTERV